MTAVSLNQFQLAVNLPNCLPGSRSYRPPSWPPSRDWVCVEDREGNAVSRWGDPIWDISSWVGRRIRVNFGDGEQINRNSPVVDGENANILRMLVTWKLWGPRAPRSPKSVISNFFDEFRKIIKICSDNGILASRLMRFPAVIDAVASAIAPSKFAYVIAELDQLRSAESVLGFSILNKEGIRRLKALQPERTKSQTEYIPPRIWNYQLGRLKKCLDDFIEKRSAVEECYRFCMEAYRANFGDSMENRKGHWNPFYGNRTVVNGSRSGLTYYGPFVGTAEKFGIKDLLDEWVEIEGERSKGVLGLSTYLSMVTFAGMAYVANFTLMRKEELGSLRVDCLQFYNDDKLGKIPVICGETTKTDADSDARWVAARGVEVAIEAMRAVALLRLSSEHKGASGESLLLLPWATEPWAAAYGLAKYRIQEEVRPSVDPIAHALIRFPKLFNPDSLRISKADHKIALSVCPTLDLKRFRVGVPWPLAWHQFRRTGVVNMFAYGKNISDSSIRLQLKHRSELMPFYYGRGSTSLRLNEEMRIMILNAQYEAFGRDITEVCSKQFVSPHGEEHKQRLLVAEPSRVGVRIFSERDFKRYEKAAKENKIFFRRTILGGCMNSEPCSGDGVESVVMCMGGKNGSSCSHLVLDKKRVALNRTRLKGVVERQSLAAPETPRFRALEQERLGLELYFAAIK